ncbi:hypothetical protein [Maribellus maritimus]|uniref:hypothetical protein n=1 Tax=Maribellus maritimus TaxID=2870838 RepID=UPI001EEBB60A|nr:hypothetical protein [Maribellus maritimus]MCG6189123.1 hypothetical protein [Maribellus maritimus]
MSTKKIHSEDGKSAYRIFSDDKVEKVNPIEYYKSYEIKKRATVFRDLLKSTHPSLASTLNNSFFEKRAEDSLIGFFEQKEQTDIHNNFLTLLQTSRKKEQEKLLKGMSLNPDQLYSLIIKSHKDHNYLYSRYLFENLPKGTKEEDLPEVILIEYDNTVKKIGSTGLSDGELKNLIEHRKVIVSHFFEKDDVWHCFFLTYNSIAGKENHNQGQPHFHYISSAFGIQKDDFIESMRTGKYKSTSIHIDLLDYGNQPKEKTE